MNDVNELEAKILEYNKIYYNTGNAVISDEEYDALKAKLRELKPDSIVFNSVGAATTTALAKQFTHINKMLSLENVFTPEDLRKYFTLAGLYNDVSIAMEDKLDGLACSLHYKDGVLDVAATRGNGFVGEIITPQVMHLDTVPNTIPKEFADVCEIRGEIFMPLQAFEAYNARAEATGHKTFISARNAAIGSVNSKDPRTAAVRGCVFVAYTYIGPHSTSHSRDMENLSMLGFKTTMPTVFPLCDIDNFARIASMRLEERRKYGIDGVVFKVNDIATQVKLGFNNTCPKWAVAFKQNIEVAETIIESIDWQVGRMGALTPVARLQSVILSDALISNATLHNWNHIQSLGLGIGDRVLIVRSGGVIPKLNLVLDKANPAVDIIKPTNCPSCNSELMDNDGMLSCINVNGCKAIRLERLIYACSKEAMDIKGIGPEVIRHAFETGQISTVADLFTPKAARAFASRIPSTAEENLPKFMMLVKEASKVSRESAIVGLCINSISTVSARMLASEIDQLTDLLTLSKETLTKVLTPFKLGNFLEFIKDAENVKLIEALDLVLEFPPRPKTFNGLADMTFVVTGSFESVSRKQIEQTILNNGGKVVGKVSAKTDFLFCGENAGTKFDDATRLEVNILYEKAILGFFKSKRIDIL